MRVQWAPSTAKHGVARDRAMYVMKHARLLFLQPPVPPDRPLQQIVYLGDDAQGHPLEVMAVELTPDHLLVIHVMRLRPKYRELYGEAQLWLDR